MKILCQKCRKEFEISAEKIEQIKKNFIGDITPIDFLDYFGTWSGRCGDSSKKHDFIWSLDFCDQVKELIKENKDIDGRLYALTLTSKKVNDTVEQLKQKLEEFEIKKDEIKKDGDMLVKEKGDLREKVMMLTGIDDITFWEIGEKEESEE